MKKNRDPNLDFLRAIAILLVLIYHIHGMWPVNYPEVAPFTGLGKYGVTLFFVLSGWLIGGIYWKERSSVEGFSLITFWKRRWFRTIPPYLAGMALGYGVVFIARGQPFDLSYLYFGQNYLHSIPYYTISWSLCVEEHFYLFLPFLGLLALRLPRRAALVLLWILSTFPAVFRFLDPNVNYTIVFGYSKAATHLVSEGLILGVAAAFTNRFFPETWSNLQIVARWAAFPAIFAFIWIGFLDPKADFYIGQSIAALCCVVWLTATSGKRALPLAGSKIMFAIAISSYSVYLTHSVAIHIGLRFARSSGSFLSNALCLAVWLTVIVLVGGGFYFCIEKTSIRVRDALSKPRSA